MRVLITFIFLVFPNIVYSKIGDVYFCNSKQYNGINQEHQKKETSNIIFKFKRTGSELIFKQKFGYFRDTVFKVIGTDKNQNSEMFKYGDYQTSMFKYMDGKFFFSQVTYSDVVMMSGTCETF